MELGLGSTLLPGDPRLIDHIVAEVKSQGIFDQFRKECIADVDTKPAYQNLNARVESSVNSFLNKQTWRADLNKNQLRETLRKHIHDAPYLEVGVDRIVDQVVNPKVYSVFMPKIEDVVYKFLGIERPKPQRNGACDLKDLLPTDLDPVSPESDRGSIKDESMEIVEEDEKKVVNGDEEKPSVSNIESKSVEVSASPVKKDNTEIENKKEPQAMDTSPVKTVLNTSFKSDEGIKTEEEEEESPDFEPIDMHLNESNMSNDSHLSGISELTSHRSGSPDFATEFARDNFDCSNQDSQLSKVSSNSRLSIVTDIGSSNHGSTPKSDAKEDSKSTKDNFKSVKDFDSNKDSKFNFDVTKIKDNSKTSSSSKESSRDASEYKDNKTKDESRGKGLNVKHESRSSRGKERESRRHSSKRRHRSRSKDKIESDSQESKDYYQKSKEIKIKDIEKKEDTSDEISDLKDRYKEKIRELREKIELTEKGKLGKINPDLSKDKKDSSKDKEDPKKSSHKSSSSRSSSHHSKSSRSSETKESRDKSSSRHDERRHSNGKGESKSSSKSRRDYKSDNRSSERSKDKKRRDEKKSKSTDDHSSLRKNLNDRRSSDRDGSDGSSSKYSHKTSFSANTSSGKFGPTSELAKDNKEQHSSGETDSVHDSLYVTLKGNDGLSKKVDPGSSEMSLPLKKRRLLSEESQDENSSKKKRSNEKKAMKRKLEQLDCFKSDSDVASVPDEERVQIVEYADDEYDQPYPDKELTLSLEETKKIILDAELPSKPSLSEMEQSILSEMMADTNMTKAIIDPKKVVLDAESTMSAQPKLSEMEQSIHQSLKEMMSEHKTNEADIEPKRVILDTEPTPPAEPKLSQMEQTVHESLSEMMAEFKTSEADIEPKKTTIETESILPSEPNMSAMDQSIQQSLSEMMADHKTSETDVEPVKVSTVMDSSSLLEALTDDSSTDKDAIAAMNTADVILDNKIAEVGKSDANVEENSEASVEKSDQDKECMMEVKENKNEASKDISGSKNEHEADEKDKLSIENQLEQFEAFDDEIEKAIVEKADVKASEAQENNENEKSVSEMKKPHGIEKQQSSEVSNIQENTEKVISEKSEKCSDIEKMQNTEVSDVQEMTENEKSNEIEMKENSVLSVVQENSENISPEIENSAAIEKNENIEKTSPNLDNTTKVVAEADTKNTDETAQDDESQANSDEFNEDDTLVIDEDANEKEPEDIEKSKVAETLSKIEKVEENSEKKSSEESQSNDIEILEAVNNDNTSELKNIIEDKFSNKLVEQIGNEKTEKLNEPETTDNSSVKASESVEEAKEEIKNQLINELAKLDENDSDDDKHEIKESISDECVSNDAPIDVIKLDDSPAKSDDTIKMDSDSDSDIDIVEIKDGDEGYKAQDKIEEFDPYGEDSLEVEKVNVHEDQDSMASSEKPVESICDPLATDSSNQEPAEEAHCSTVNRVNSPDDEECHYFDNDNEKYLSFKKYLDRLEADLVKKIEEKVETAVKESSPVVEPVESLATVSAPLKRKLSPSPIVDNIIKDNNNDGLITTKEPVVMEVSNEEIPVEEPIVVLKKRKVGRMKKSNSSGSVTSSTSQPEQPQDKEQQPQAAMVNGENFMMPLSPESDISVSSDKNLGGNSKEDKSTRGQRSSQRYSSDDLYKPRPLFTLSSRRTTRRYHQA